MRRKKIPVVINSCLHCEFIIMNPGKCVCAKTGKIIRRENLKYFDDDCPFDDCED